jgi:hypothetical protein
MYSSLHGPHGAASNWREVMLKRIFGVAVVLSLVACATAPVPTESAKIVPLARMTSLAFSQPRDGFGKVIIKRDSGLGACLLTARVYVNAVAVADLDPGEKVEVFLPQGAQMLGASINTPFNINRQVMEATADVKTDHPLVFAVSVLACNDARFQPTGF